VDLENNMILDLGFLLTTSLSVTEVQ